MLFMLVTNLRIGNPESEAPASQDTKPEPFDKAQDRPFDKAQDRPFDRAQDRPFDRAQDRLPKLNSEAGAWELARTLIFT
jgi:hypothetical protein